MARPRKYATLAEAIASDAYRRDRRALERMYGKEAVAAAWVTKPRKVRARDSWARGQFKKDGTLRAGAFQPKNLECVVCLSPFKQKTKDQICCDAECGRAYTGAVAAGRGPTIRVATCEWCKKEFEFDSRALGSFHRKKGWTAPKYCSRAHAIEARGFDDGTKPDSHDGLPF